MWGQPRSLRPLQLSHAEVTNKAVRIALKMNFFFFFFRPQEINKEELEGNSMRCGRKLAKDGDVSTACGLVSA